jgi:membrane carboxypeptidase/penicillin-binding protein PbpC
VIQGERRQQTNWVPDTSGYSTFTVIDAQGRTDRVTVYVD